jgi:TolB-like protein
MSAPDIFLSYNREDQARAKLFAEAFTSQGFSVWWDVGLKTGEAYDEVTENALRTAKAVVVLWSKKSVVSRWVRAEATLADRNKTLVPCMIEACERPIMFELTQTAELGHWQGDAADRAWAAFLGDVRRFVAKDAAPVATAPAVAIATPTVQETLKPGQSGSAPSLAVLPFTNRSSLPEDEVFADGMVEDVISALSQGVNVRVLGASATANLSRAAITDLAGVGRQLGVQYLLEGNVRRAGANLRVTTQLLEAASGAVLWAGKFDRPLAELAELQEELVTEIASSLDAQVFSREMESALRKPGDITAWEAVMRSYAAYGERDPASLQRAYEEAWRAVAIAPDYGPAHAMLGFAFACSYLVGSDDPAEAQRIRATAERAIALAPEDAFVLSHAAASFSFAGFPEIAVRHSVRAVRKAPGHGMGHHCHGMSCVIFGRPEEALSHFNTAARLMAGSHIVWGVKQFQSAALSMLGRFEEAEAAIDESISLIPTFGYNHVVKAWFCKRLGRDAEALRHVTTARRLEFGLAPAERHFRRVYLNSPGLEDGLAAIRALYASTEPGA